MSKLERMAWNVDPIELIKTMYLTKRELNPEAEEVKVTLYFSKRELRELRRRAREWSLYDPVPKWTTSKTEIDGSSLLAYRVTFTWRH